MPVLKTNMSHKILLRYKKVFFKLTLLRYRFHVGDPLLSNIYKNINGMKYTKGKGLYA